MQREKVAHFEYHRGALELGKEAQICTLHLVTGGYHVFSIIILTEVVDSVSYNTGSCKMMFPINNLVYSANITVHRRI